MHLVHAQQELTCDWVTIIWECKCNSSMSKKYEWNK